MRNSLADLENALLFVMARIEAEATRECEPLDEEEKLLLRHLPTVSPAPIVFDPDLPILLPVPRDVRYERLCSCARAAYTRDVAESPDGVRRWQSAAVVLNSSRHPVGWLLQSAGVRAPRPWWDRWLLVGVALSVTACAVAVPVLLSSTSSVLMEVAAPAGCVGIVIAAYIALKKSQAWQVQEVAGKNRGRIGTDAP